MDRALIASGTRLSMAPGTGRLGLWEARVRIGQRLGGSLALPFGRVATAHSL